jgi:hypothetical protein
MNKGGKITIYQISLHYYTFTSHFTLYDLGNQSSKTSVDNIWRPPAVEERPKEQGDGQP